MENDRLTRSQIIQMKILPNYSSVRDKENALQRLWWSFSRDQAFEASANGESIEQSIYELTQFAFNALPKCSATALLIRFVCSSTFTSLYAQFKGTIGRKGSIRSHNYPPTLWAMHEIPSVVTELIENCSSVTVYKWRLDARSDLNCLTVLRWRASPRSWALSSVMVACFTMTVWSAFSSTMVKKNIEWVALLLTGAPLNASTTRLIRSSLVLLPLDSSSKVHLWTKTSLNVSVENCRIDLPAADGRCREPNLVVRKRFAVSKRHRSAPDDRRSGRRARSERWVMRFASFEIFLSINDWVEWRLVSSVCLLKDRSLNRILSWPAQWRWHTNEDMFSIALSLPGIILQM